MFVLPSYHSRVLLYSSLQEPLEYGPFPHICSFGDFKQNRKQKQNPKISPFSAQQSRIYLINTSIEAFLLDTGDLRCPGMPRDAQPSLRLLVFESEELMNIWALLLLLLFSIFRSSW